ncbi:MAG: periplasmic protein TonB [Verrucomicrobiota bacterium]|jgi:protein TonB
MPKPILYRPAPRWQFWAFLGGALLVHGIAVVAAMKREPPPMDLSTIPDAVVIGLEQAPQPPEPTPPPEEPEAPPPPPPPTSEPEFKEEQPTPPPKPKQQVKIQPLAKPTQVGATVTAAGAKANATYAPKPEYPYEARSRHLTGSGVAVVSVDPSGNVTSAEMAQSIGNPILDNSATSAFRRWKFKPGSVSRAKIPITFTMTGASY